MTHSLTLKFVFDGVKTSIKGQYGQAPLQYQGISGIQWYFFCPIRPRRKVSRAFLSSLASHRMNALTPRKQKIP